MRSRCLLLDRVAAIALIAGLNAACSADMSRLGSPEPLFTGSTPNQREIIDGAPARRPADVTGSIEPERAVRTADLPPPPIAPAAAPPIAAAPPPPPPAAPPRLVAAASPPPVVTPTATPVASAPPPAPTAAPPAAARVVVPGKGGWEAAGGTAITLRDGETLGTLSQRYGVPVEALKTANGLKDEAAIRPGQQIVIPIYSAAPLSPAAPAAAAPAAAETPRPARIVPLPASPRTALLSPIPDAKPRIAAPAPVATPPAPAPPVASTPAAPAPAAAAPAAPAATPVPAKTGVYVVKKGDTIEHIARTHKVTAVELKRANALSSDALQIGQQLTIPGKSPAAAEAPPSPPAEPAKPAAPTVAEAKPAGPAPSLPAKPPATALQAPATAGAPKEQVALVKEPAPEAEPERKGQLGFRWPVRGRVISDFASRSSGERNDGIDIAVPEGTSVKAAEDGEVIYAGGDVKGFGNLVIVKHADGYVSAYAHASEILVKKGEKVARGQIVARSGATGNVNQPKLHFELRKDQRPVDPKPYLEAN